MFPRKYFSEILSQFYNKPMRYIRFDPWGIFRPKIDGRCFKVKIAQNDEDDLFLKRIREYEVDERQRKLWEIGDKLKELLIEIVSIDNLIYILDEKQRGSRLLPAQRVLDIMYGNRIIWPFGSVNKEELAQHVENLRAQYRKVNSEIYKVLKEYIRITYPEIYEKYKDNDLELRSYLDEVLGLGSVIRVPGLVLDDLYFTYYVFESDIPEELKQAHATLEGLLGTTYIANIFWESRKRTANYLQKHFNIPEIKAEALASLVKSAGRVIVSPDIINFEHRGKVNLRNYYFNRANDQGLMPYYVDLILASDPIISSFVLTKEMERRGLKPINTRKPFEGLTDEDMRTLRTYFYYRDVMDLYKRPSWLDKWNRMDFEYFQNLPEFRDAEKKVMDVLFKQLMMLPPSSLQSLPNYNPRLGIPESELMQEWRRMLQSQPPTQPQAPKYP
jgi:hypothetical protein